MDTSAFLKTVITTDEGYFQLLIKNNSDEWSERWFDWPNDLERIVQVSLEQPERDVYFSAHLFEKRDSHKQYTLPSRTIQSDLDEALVPQINKPNILVETSPHRHQGYWFLNEAPTTHELEINSRHVTYSIPDADRSGWSLGHKMRVPGTYNHKYPSGPKLVKVITANIATYRDLIIDPSVHAEVADPTDFWFPEPIEGGVRELWNKFRRLLPRRVIAAYDRTQEDRSAALWALYLALFRVNATADEVFALAKASANNKFASNKYHGDLDLAKDILRAQHSLNQNLDSSDDIRDQLAAIRRMQGLTVSEKRTALAAKIRDHMQQHGAFLHSNEGESYYVREDTGRPIIIARESEQLDVLLDIRYGLNKTEVDQRFTVSSLISSTLDRGTPVQIGALSHYNSDMNTMLLHSGGRDVYYIDKHDVSLVSNGQMGVVFPWGQSVATFKPDIDNKIPLEEIFEGSFDNLEELTPAQATALLKTWLYFIFFKDAVQAKPLILFLGSPGSGKTTLFKKIYSLIYGPNKALASITNAENFDQIVSMDPLVVFDNVDNYYYWLPDKLALSAGRTDLTKRKLYSDTDSIIMRRKALIGISAHNPRFYREDITDRLIMLTFHRRTTFPSEDEIIGKILDHRNRYWGTILTDLQRILKEPKPPADEIPRYRISDFARYGVWISRALGFEDDFRSALVGNAQEQVTFNLGEEMILIETIENWLLKRNHEQDNEYFSSTQLWEKWLGASKDEAGFRRAYHNPLSLGKKLWSLQATLNNVFTLKYKLAGTGTRVWNINQKVE